MLGLGPISGQPLAALPAAAGAYDPTASTLTGYWRASYAGSPWTPTASGGTSGTNGDLAEATNPPATGAAVNGYTSGDFDGTNDQLNSATLCQDFVSDASGWIASVFYADSAVADPTTAAYYLGAGLLTDDTSGQIGLTFSAGGLYFGCSNGGDFEAVAATCSTGAWHVGQARWNSTDIEVRVDNGAWQTLARVVVTSAVDGIRVGINYDNTVAFDGKILETLTAQYRVGDTESDDYYDYAQARYFGVASGDIAGTAAATATATGALLGSGALVGTAASTATATGALLGAGALAATGAATASATGAVTGSGALAGTAAAVATATGALLGAGALVGAATSTATTFTTEAAKLSQAGFLESQ